MSRILKISFVVTLLVLPLAGRAMQLVPPPTGSGICIQRLGEGARCNTVRGSSKEGYCEGGSTSYNGSSGSTTSGGAAGSSTTGSPAAGTPASGQNFAAQSGNQIECDYTFCDLMNLLINASNIFFGIAGGLALMFFVYGSFWLIASAGNASWVKKGTDSMKAAILGLLVVLIAYQFIGELMLVFTRTGYKFDAGRLVSRLAFKDVLAECKPSEVQLRPKTGIPNGQSR